MFAVTFLVHDACCCRNLADVDTNSWGCFSHCCAAAQVESVEACVRGAGPLPWQFQAVQQAASFSAAGHDTALQAQQVNMLLVSMLSLDAPKRCTSVKLCKTRWLAKAMATPLPRCPLVL